MGGEATEGPGQQGSGLHPPGPNPGLVHPSCLVFPWGRSGLQPPGEMSPWKALAVLRHPSG